jgi:uncharacterized protein YcbX
MYVKELWRYPVKSMAGEPLTQIHVDELGFTDDRKVMVLGPNRRVVTSRTHPGLLGLKGMIGFDGQPRISGHVWNSPEALALVRETVGPDAELVHYEGPERFDVLPLLVATDGAIAAFDHDGRRLRPNMVIGGVVDLSERSWPGKCLLNGEVAIGVQDLRPRCVMTTFDPETLQQDAGILKEIVRKFDGKLALNCYVVHGGEIHVGDAVELVTECELQPL